MVFCCWVLVGWCNESGLHGLLSRLLLFCCVMQGPKKCQAQCKCWHQLNPVLQRFTCVAMQASIPLSTCSGLLEKRRKDGCSNWSCIWL